jgi:hypothetical protein
MEFKSGDIHILAGKSIPRSIAIRNGIKCGRIRMPL